MHKRKINDTIHDKFIITSLLPEGYKTTYENKFYYFDTSYKFHRLDGPAWISSYGTMEWYNHGILHRMDGPAIFNPNSNVEFYYLHGHPINTKKSYDKIIFNLKEQPLLDWKGKYVWK